MAPMSVLIVDDDVEALRLVGMMLEREGYQILVASSGNQAIDKAVTEKPSLIILDVMMAGLNGYQVTTKLRKHPATSNIPILLFTAKGNVSDKITGFQAGADDYLTKPVNPKELAARVKTLLERKAQTVQKPEKSHIISFLPVQGGTGNSTLAINTAIETRQMFPNKRVALVELQAGGGSIALQLGLKIPSGLHALAKLPLAALSQSHINEHISQHASGLHLLLSSPRPAGMTPQLNKEYTHTILHYLANDYDYVFLDLPKDLTPNTQDALGMSKEIIITLSPTHLSIALAREIIDSLETLNIATHKIRAVLINRVAHKSAISETTVARMIQKEIISRIPPVPDLAHKSIQSGKPMVLLNSQGLISQQIRLVVQSIVNQT